MKFQLLINGEIVKNKVFFIALKPSAVVFILLINVKMPTIVGTLTFMSWINFMLSYVEFEKSYNFRLCDQKERSGLVVECLT